MKCIIELDGQIHDLEEKKEYDNDRDKIISEKGFLIFGIKNEDVMNQESFNKILDKILHM